MKRNRFTEEQIIPVPLTCHSHPANAWYLVFLLNRRKFASSKSTLQILRGYTTPMNEPRVQPADDFAGDAEPDHQDGFVLIAVIWIAGLLAVAATAFTISVRVQTLAGRNAVYGAQAEAVADGLARLSAFRLATLAGPDATLKTNGEVAQCIWPPNITATIAIQDQGGLVDLNTASPVLVGKMLSGLGIDAARADGIINALQDFRDPDAQSLASGLEPDVYPGKAYGPKNAPFDVVEEIDQIPEIDDAAFRKLLPLVTVSSQQTGIDLAKAPASLLNALGAEDNDTTRLAAYSSPSPAKNFAVDVMVRLSNGTRYHRHALISVLRQPDRPFAILAWQRGPGMAVDAASTPPQTPCLTR
jgi:general secretion pathway protein K